MPSPVRNDRLMAPWWRDLQTATEDSKLTKAEVKSKVEPWADQLGATAYGDRARELLANQAQPPVRLTRGARTELANLAEAHPGADGKYHFSTSVENLAWSYGSGVRPMPGHAPAGPSISMTVMFPFIDIHPSYEVSVDERTRTITVKLEGKSEGSQHPRAAARPLDLDIPVERPQKPGAQYRIIVRDANPHSEHPNKIIGRTTFRNMLPM